MKKKNSKKREQHVQHAQQTIGKWKQKKREGETIPTSQASEKWKDFGS